MDPATIIGTTGAIVGMIDVVAKLISTLRSLRDRWTTIALQVTSLISQLTSLRAALGRISEWVTSDLAHEPQHFQLVIDIKETLLCCEILVKSMEAFVKPIESNQEGTLDLESKLKVFFGNREIENFQTYIQQQTSALNLLLTACNWYEGSIWRVYLAKKPLLKIAANLCRSRKPSWRNQIPDRSSVR